MTNELKEWLKSLISLHEPVQQIRKILNGLLDGFRRLHIDAGIFKFIQEFQGFISPGILAVFVFGEAWAILRKRRVVTPAAG